MTQAIAPVAMLVISITLAVACSETETPVEQAHSSTRVVTLAPHLTELMFAAGSGDALIGVSAYSDHPDEATVLPVVSDAFTVDQEQLALLAPDLVLAWQSGTPAHVIDELRNAGYRVEVLRTRGLQDIAYALRRIGTLTGSQERAIAAADEFSGAMTTLRKQYAGREPVRVFYQVSDRPLYTINGEHHIGEILELCGAHNIFADLGELAQAVTVEAVVDRNPEVFFAGSADGDAAFAEWQRWPHLQANRYGNHFVVNSDEIGRPSMRLVSAAKSVCEQLQTARDKRSAAE